MSANGKQEQFRLGFLTAVEIPDRGHVGGLLVTNRLGRPLEFQCTTPVKANRTQEILYGPTLVPFLLAELIGRTLVEKVGVKPDLVLAEQPDMLELREHVSLPVACLCDDAPHGAASASGERLSAEPGPAKLTLGRQVLRFHPAHGSDREAAEKKSNLVPRDADLREPFVRVREALIEATRHVVLK